MAKPSPVPLIRLIFSLLAFANGGFMLADGIHVLVRGKYIGPTEPGAWAFLFRQLGVDIFRLGPMFIVFGICWLLFAYYLRSKIIKPRRWMILCILTLWYLPFGTIIAIVLLYMLQRISRDGQPMEIAAGAASPGRHNRK